MEVLSRSGVGAEKGWRCAKSAYNPTMDKQAELAAIAAWLNQAFIQWQAQQGARRTIRDFGEYLGVEYSLLTKWLKGVAAPGNENVIKLGNRLGPQIYDLRGWPRPEL